MAAKRIQRKHEQVPRTLKRIQRSEKLVQAASLPKILNMNARSIYNKVEEFKTFVSEREIDLVCMSETWERDDETLDKIINIEDLNDEVPTFTEEDLDIEILSNSSLVSGTQIHH